MEATNQKPEIIYEDQHLLVINKPSGMVVNVSQTAKGDTLQEFVQRKFPELFDCPAATEVTSDDFYSRAGIVHRLDKETSGVILVAKTPEAFANLQAQFKSRAVKKEYLVLAFGEIEEELFSVRAPVGRSPVHRTKMAVTEDGRPAETSFEVVEVISFADQKGTLLKAFPKTGRTHQIRVHLAALGHPVLGDSIYAGRRRSEISRSKFGRLMLHASRITFNHPHSGEEVTFESPAPSGF